jgi:hypothetical protein
LTPLERDALTKLRYGLLPTPAEAVILHELKVAAGWDDFTSYGKYVQDLPVSAFADLLAGRVGSTKEEE